MLGILLLCTAGTVQAESEVLTYRNGLCEIEKHEPELSYKISLLKYEDPRQRCKVMYYKLATSYEFSPEELKFIYKDYVHVNQLLLFLMETRSYADLEREASKLSKEQVYGDRKVGIAEFAFAVCGVEALEIFKKYNIVGDVKLIQSKKCNEIE